MPSRDITLDIIAKVESREVERLAKEMDAAAKSTDGASAAAKRQRDTLEVLDREIASAKTRVREIGEEFRRTGKIDVFDNLRAANKELRGLERIRTDVTKALVTGLEDAGKQAAQGIPEFGFGIVRSISSAVSDMPPQAQGAIYGAIAGAIAVGAPLIGGAAAAAITGGIGAGGLAAGIALAVKDPAVSSAFSTLSGELGKSLESDAQVFAGPLIHAADIFRDEFAKMEPDIAGTFGTLSAEVEPLARGLGEMARAAMPGIREAAAAAGPLFDELARDLPEVGHSAGIFLHDVADSAPGAVHALSDLLAVADVGMRTTGTVVKELSFALDLIHNNGNLALTVADFKTAELEASKSGGVFGKLGEIFAGTSGETDSLTASVRRLSDELSGSLNDALALKRADDEWQRSLLNLKTSVEQNGHSLDATTAAGLANRDALLASAQAAERDREAAIAAAGGQNASKEAIEAANAKYAANIETLRRNAIALGYNKDQVDALIKGLDAIPTVKRTEIQIRVTGDVTTFRDVQHMSDGSYTARKTEMRAGGGPVSAGVPYIVGERGAELFVPGQSGTIVPNDQVRAMVGGQTNGSSSGGIVINLRAYSDRFSLRQVLQDLALHGVH